MAQFESTKYLLCGLGDGSLIYFVMSTRGLAEKKMVTLGTKPAVLRRFKTQSTMNLFAFSDRQPRVIYSSREKLVVYEINFGQVNHMCPLNAEAYKDSLALVNDGTITIGTIDEFKKLYVRTVALAESPLRITYQEETQTFGVLTMRHEIKSKDGMTPARASASTLASSKSSARSSIATTTAQQATPAINEGQEQKIFSLLIIDQNTFEILHAHQFMQQEFGLSLISSKLGEDSTPYFIVGTGLVNSAKAEPKAGRLLLFQWKDGMLHIMAEKDVTGACYALCNFNNELSAVVNDKLRIFKWTLEKMLRETRFLETGKNCILVGNLSQKHATPLVQCKTMEGMFEEISLKNNDPEPSCMKAIEFLDDDTFIGAQHADLLVWQKHSAASENEISMHVIKLGQIHVGDVINVLRQGSLAMQNLGEVGEEEKDQRTVLFGTVHGAIGMVKPLPQEFFELLTEIQRRLTRVIKSVGKIEHEVWRSISNEAKTQPMEGFVDGDLVETFLDLDEPMAEEFQGLEINDGLGMQQDTKVEDIIKMIKHLTQMH